MNTFKRIFALLKRMLQWHRNPGSGSQAYRVDPLTAITVIGLITTSWGLGTGIGAEKLGNDLSQDLRNSPQNIENLIEDMYKNNQISGTQREIELQKLQEMTPLFLGAADAIQDKGQDIGFQTAAQALFETMMNFGPGKKAGSLVGATSTGQGLDQLYSVKNIIESIEGSSISWTPFSEEEAQLVQQIQDIMGTDADALFLARMRTKINILRSDYIGLLKENPCDKDKILADFHAELTGLGWGAGTDVYGEGEKFATHAAFIDWLIGEATIDIDIPCEETSDEDNPVDEVEQTQPDDDTEIADCVAAPDMFDIAYTVDEIKTTDLGSYSCLSTYAVSNLSSDLLAFKSLRLLGSTGNEYPARWYTYTAEPGETVDYSPAYYLSMGSTISYLQYTKVIVYRATSACLALITDENEEEWASFVIELDCPCND